MVRDARPSMARRAALSEFVPAVHYTDVLRLAWRVRCSAITLRMWTTTDADQVTCDACLALMAQDVINNLSVKRVYETNDR